MASKWIESSRLYGLVQNTINSTGSRDLVGTLVKGVAAAVSGLFLSRLLGTVVQALIVRRMGRELYGEYATLLISLSLFATLLGIGLDTWLLQEGGRHPERLAQRLRAVLALKAISAVILLIILGIVWSNQVTIGPAFAIGAFSIIFDSFAQTGYSAMRVQRRNTLVAVFQTITPLLLLVVLLLLERTELSVVLMIGIQAVCSVTIALVVLAQVWWQHRLGTRSQLELGYVIRNGWLFTASEGMANLYNQSVPAMLGAAVGTLAVGLFSPARNLVQLTLLVPNLMFSVSLPLLMTPNTPPAEYRRMIRLLLLASVAYGLVVFAGLWLFSSLLIQIVYGPEYKAAAPLVQVMSLVPLLKACSFVWVAIMLSYLQQRLRVIFQAITVVLSLAAGWLVIPAYGIAGAAWLYVGIELLLCVLYGIGAWLVLRWGRP